MHVSRKEKKWSWEGGGRLFDVGCYAWNVVKLRKRHYQNLWNNFLSSILVSTIWNWPCEGKRTFVATTILIVEGGFLNLPAENDTRVWINGIAAAHAILLAPIFFSIYKIQFGFCYQNILSFWFFYHFFLLDDSFFWVWGWNVNKAQEKGTRLRDKTELGVQKREEISRAA